MRDMWRDQPIQPYRSVSPGLESTDFGGVTTADHGSYRETQALVEQREECLKGVLESDLQDETLTLKQLNETIEHSTGMSNSSVLYMACRESSRQTPKIL